MRRSKMALAVALAATMITGSAVGVAATSVDNTSIVKEDAEPQGITTEDAEATTLTTDEAVEKFAEENGYSEEAVETIKAVNKIFSEETDTAAALEKLTDMAVNEEAAAKLQSLIKISAKAVTTKATGFKATGEVEKDEEGNNKIPCPLTNINAETNSKYIYAIDIDPETGKIDVKKYTKEEYDSKKNLMTGWVPSQTDSVCAYFLETDTELQEEAE